MTSNLSFFLDQRKIRQIFRNSWEDSSSVEIRIQIVELLLNNRAPSEDWAEQIKILVSLDVTTASPYYGFAWHVKS